MLNASAMDVLYYTSPLYRQEVWVLPFGNTKVKINTFFKFKIVNIFIPISFNICFGCSKEPSH